MSVKRFRRVGAVLLVLALALGSVLYGMQTAVVPAMMPAMSGDAPAAPECPLCGDEKAINTSVCAMVCAGMTAVVPEIESVDTVMAMVVALVATRYRAGLSLAPDPSPPRPVVSS